MLKVYKSARRIEKLIQNEMTERESLKREDENDYFFNKKNFYVTWALLEENLKDKEIIKREKIKWLLILILNYFDKGHLRCNIDYLVKEIKKTLQEVESSIKLLEGEKNLEEELIKMKELKDKLENFTKESYIKNALNEAKKLNLIEFLESEENVNFTSPIVFIKNKYIYLQKTYYLEDALIKALMEKLISERFEEKSSESDFVSEDELLNLDELQIQAIKRARVSNFFILSGGPGTGKTTIIYYILRELMKRGENLKIVLSSPTGRATERMKESFKGKSENLDFLTLHKLLGIKKHKKQEENLYLNYDIIIVDESSMIDAGLFLNLLERTSPKSKLILLGDKNQLPSINEGSIYSDILESKSNKIKEHTARLEKNFRSSKNILNLAQKVIEGKSDDVISLIKNSEVVFEEIDNKNFKDNLKKYLEETYENLTLNDFNLKNLKDEGEIQERVNKVLKNAILSAKKIGTFGTKNINRILREEYIKKYKTEIGLPIIITENDYKNLLFNGQRGVIFYEDGDSFDERINKYIVIFQNNKIQKINAKSILNYEINFAQTIHKSQGSEYEEMSLYLEANPFITRELLYTAITRAKKSIKIISNLHTIKEVCKRKVERDSKIKEFLDNY